MRFRNLWHVRTAERLKWTPTAWHWLVKWSYQSLKCLKGGNLHHCVTLLRHSVNTSRLVYHICQSCSYSKEIWFTSRFTYLHLQVRVKVQIHERPFLLKYKHLLILPAVSVKMVVIRINNIDDEDNNLGLL